MSRFLAATALLLAFVPEAAWAQPAALDEAAVIRLARERAPASATAHADAIVADARAETEGLFPNPSLSWEREALLAGAGASQDVLRLSVPLQIAGPLAKRSLALAEREWSRAETSLARDDAVIDALLSYYALAAAERRRGIEQVVDARLEEAARVLASREGAGTASGYESTRLAVARELAKSELAQAEAVVGAWRARLASSLGIDAAQLRVDVDRALETPPLPPSSPTAAGHRGLAQARSAERHAVEAAERAAWTWVPPIELSAGAIFASEAGLRAGYVAGISIEIPIFDSGAGLRARVRAERSAATVRTEALGRQLQGEAEAARASFLAAAAELRRFDEATGQNVEVLLRAAESGYREGERSVVELLDAQRAETEVAQQRLELVLAIKRAEALLRAATGKLP